MKGLILKDDLWVSYLLGTFSEEVRTIEFSALKQLSIQVNVTLELVLWLDGFEFE